MCRSALNSRRSHISPKHWQRLRRAERYGCRRGAFPLLSYDAFRPYLLSSGSALSHTHSQAAAAAAGGEVRGKGDRNERCAERGDIFSTSSAPCVKENAAGGEGLGPLGTAVKVSGDRGLEFRASRGRVEGRTGGARFAS